ncbi:MAG: outer membrane beta-barrel family protein [Ferruginibacter sp.]
MYKKIWLFLCLLSLAQISFSQKADVTGIIKDTTSNINLKNAVVSLLTTKDTILVRFARAKEDGSYVLKNITPGKYILMVTHPLFADFVDDIEVKNTEQKIPAIAVTPKSKLLEAVILKTGSPIRIKGDTTVYTADSFKVSANANVEELLKKLPGIQVDKNGQIKAMGETVEKVLVDGEEFFGDDPGMAIKNLRADAVKEVQVFDKKSDQAEFTGIDDGKTQKTINLKLKEDKKTGYFGKIDLAGGLQKSLDDRYNNNILFSTFKGKRKLSGFFLNGNTGQDGLNWQDNEKYGGQDDNFSMSMDDDGGFMFYSRGGSTDDEPYVNTENGFIKNINAGLQYNNKWNDKQTLNLSPKYNSQDYNNTSKTYIQQFLGGDSTLNTNANKNTHVNRNNFKLSGSYDIKIDSANTLKLTLKANFYNTQSEEFQNAETKRETGIPVNTSTSLVKTNSDKQVLYGSLLYKHKFKKARRTLSVNADWNLLSTSGNNYITSHNESFDVTNPFVIDKNQLIDNEKSTQKVSAKIIYTEPLSKKYSLELAHEISYNSGKNNQATFTYSPATNKYDAQVDSLTNNFDQKIIINKPSVKINYSDKKIKYNFGSGFGLTHFDLLDKTFNKNYTRNYINFFPSAGFKYSYKSNHNFSFNYNGSTQQPTINQLQPLRNSTDEFNQYIGNPDLKPSFSNSFQLSNNGYDFIKDRWTYQSLRLNLTSNSITNNVVINPNSGKTTTQPINTDGNVSANFYSGIGFKIKKIDTRLQIGPGFNYARFAQVTNNVLNYSKTFTPSLGVYASKSKEKKYDFSINNNFSYNYNKNSQTTTNNNYFTNQVGIDATVYIHKVWSIGSDYQFLSRQKTALATGNLNNALWNAKLQRTFKSNEFTAYFKVRDILNQNIGIDRSYYGNTFTEVSNDRLKRYFLLGFAWDFKNKAAKPK